MSKLEMSQGCGLYCIIFMAIMITGVSVGPENPIYNTTTIVGGILIVLFIPFLIIWYLIVRKYSKIQPKTPPSISDLPSQQNYTQPPIQFPEIYPSEPLFISFSNILNMSEKIGISDVARTLGIPRVALLQYLPDWHKDLNFVVNGEWIIRPKIDSIGTRSSNFQDKTNIICSHCGTENNLNNVNCECCGANLQEK